MSLESCRDARSVEQAATLLRLSREVKGFDSALGWTVGSDVNQDGTRLPAVFARLMNAALNLDYPWTWPTRHARQKGAPSGGTVSTTHPRPSPGGKCANDSRSCNTQSPAQQNFGGLNRKMNMASKVSSDSGNQFMRATGGYVAVSFTHKRFKPRCAPTFHAANIRSTWPEHWTAAARSKEAEQTFWTRQADRAFSHTAGCAAC